MLPLEKIGQLDVYFDGCDQFDAALNALKSGGGIHTLEKIFAASSQEFVLLGDSAKRVEHLDTIYPLTLEVMQQAVTSVIPAIESNFDCSAITGRGDHPTAQGNTMTYTSIVDVYFKVFPDLDAINRLKMLPGVVDHSLFYRMASKAIISGENGVKVYSTV